MTSQTLWFFLSRYRSLCVGLACVLVGVAVLEALSVGSLFPLMSEVLSSDSSGSGGRVLEALHTVLALSPLPDRIVNAALLLIGLMSVKACATILRDYLVAAGSAQVVFETKQRLFAKLLEAPYQYFLDRRHEELCHRVTSAPQSLGLALLLISSLVSQGVIIAAICLLLLTISWQITAGLLAIGGVVYVVLRAIARRVSHLVGRQRTDSLMKEIGIVTEYCAGIKEILTAGVARRWAEAYSHTASSLRELHVKDGVWQSVPGVAIEWAFFVLAAIMALVQKREVGGDSSSAAVPLMAVYAYAVYRMIRSLGLVSAYKLRLATQSADVALLRLALEETFPDRTTTVGKPVKFVSSVAFENVSFCYPGRQEFALRHISLTIPKGSTTAIVGQSGSGKTTFLNLLLCLYSPREGRVLLDGEDLSRFDRTDWLNHIGYVSQEAFLIDGTVSENIRFGRTGVSEADILAVGEAAYVNEFILRMPQGYGTAVGAKGMALSGGQRQRIAIARALIRHPEIIVFDEATSALDAGSEAMIQRTMDRMRHDHTLIVIAHRLSTVRYADQIVVMDAGHVVEVGTHEELVARKGRYAKLMTTSMV